MEKHATGTILISYITVAFMAILLVAALIYFGASGGRFFGANFEEENGTRYVKTKQAIEGTEYTVYSYYEGPVPLSTYYCYRSGDGDPSAIELFQSLHHAMEEVSGSPRAITLESLQDRLTTPEDIHVDAELKGQCAEWWKLSSGRSAYLFTGLDDEYDTVVLAFTEDENDRGSLSEDRNAVKICE